MKNNDNNPELLEALKAVGDLLATATFNRMGKAEWLSEAGRDAREHVRLLAIRYSVAPAETILEQAAYVARAAVAKAEGK